MVLCRSCSLKLLRPSHSLKLLLRTRDLPPSRLFGTSRPMLSEALTESSPISAAPRNLDPPPSSFDRSNTVHTTSQSQSIGSRRRRLAIKQSPGIPFEQLPYQCFQEARKVLQLDRQDKLKQLETERKRYARLRDVDTAGNPGGEAQKQRNLKTVMARIERIKILADINDPLVKRRFEDGLGDMNKPIYRYLADRKWREYRRLVLMQRIEQMTVVPDVLPKVDPTVDVKLAFIRPVGLTAEGGVQETSRASRLLNVQPGEFVDSQVSERPAWLNVQSFERGERLVSVAVIDSDVPNLQKDGFDYRCHFLASNIKISPIDGAINLAKLSETEQVLLPWIPPHSQKGMQYHRLSIFILQQKENIPIDLGVASKYVKAKDFVLRRFVDRHLLKPIGVHLFRTKWDEGTAGVMNRAGLEGADVEMKRIKVEPLPYKRRNPTSFR